MIILGKSKKCNGSAWTVASLEELAAICKKAKEQSATFEESIFEGSQIAVVLADPEENRIEVFYEGTQETDLPKNA